MKNDLKQVEHCGGLNGALYDSGQTSLHKRSDVKNGRRIIKSSLVNNVEMVKMVKEDKKHDKVDKNEDVEIKEDKNNDKNEDVEIKEDKNNEFLDFFNKFKAKRNKEIENNGTIERNRKAERFSELENFGSKSKNVSKLTAFFERKENLNQNKTENSPQKERRKKTQRKIVPLKGQRSISMFLDRKEKNGSITPNSGKRKFVDDEFDFSSMNTPEKKKSSKLERDTK